MDAQLKVELDRAKQSMLEGYRLICLYGDDELKDTAPFVTLMEDILTIRQRSASCQKALSVARKQKTVEDFDQLYAEEYKKNIPKNFNAKKVSEFKDFQKQLKDLGMMASQRTEAEAETAVAGQPIITQRMECDEFIMESEINTIDPLTKQQMQDPVKNKICGHHYDKKSILEAIGLNPRLRCPVAGCKNNQVVKKKHLKPDNELKMRILQAEPPRHDL